LAEKASELKDRGLVYVFTGDGKGKTSTALGVALRALGHGLKVFIVYFLKGDYPYGERRILSQLPNIAFTSFGSKAFVDPENIKPEEIEQAKQGLAAAREVILHGNYDLVVLDEVNLAVAWKMIELDEVISLIKNKPQNMELILTGRKANTELVKLADLVSECIKIKHPYDKGELGRKGIDW